MGSWSDLPRDIVECILGKIDTSIDLLSFSAVCKPWHLVYMQNYNRLPENLPICNFFPKACPLPMLLVPFGNGLNRKPYLYSITEKKTYNCFSQSLFRNKWIPGSAKGWLVTIDKKDKSINLLNPITTKQIPLPGLFTFDEPVSMDYQYEAKECSYINKATILFDASGEPENSVIVALVSTMQTICFCRVGDHKWTTVEHSTVHGIHDIINFEGKLYAIDNGGKLFAIEIRDRVKWTLLTEGVIAFSVAFKSELYLVESDKQILLVVRDHVEDSPTAEFQVFKLVTRSSLEYQDWYKSQNQTHPKSRVQFGWINLTSIGEQMIFLGYNHSLSLDSHAYPGCRGNRVYFADYLSDRDFYRFFTRAGPEPHDIGVYDFETKTVESLKGLGRLPSHPALWFSPCGW